MSGFMEWLHEHPNLTLAAIVVAVLLIASSFLKRNQQGQAGTSGAQGDIGGGQVVSAGGYTFVPTGSSDTSSTTSGDMNPNTAQDLQALAGFLQQFQSVPGGVTPPSATPVTPPPGGPQQTTPPVNVTVNNPPVTQKNRQVVTTKHTHGTPPETPGLPIVAKHPNNPSPLPPTREPPIKHPAQGSNHPTGGPILKPGPILAPKPPTGQFPPRKKPIGAA